MLPLIFRVSDISGINLSFNFRQTSVQILARYTGSLDVMR